MSGEGVCFLEEVSIIKDGLEEQLKGMKSCKGDKLEVVKYKTKFKTYSLCFLVKNTKESRKQVGKITSNSKESQYLLKLDPP